MRFVALFVLCLIGSAAMVPPVADCSGTSVGLTPLTDPGLPYQGNELGLYPGGNDVPASHLAAGVNLANGIRPLNAQGQPKNNGYMAFISIGMSNTNHEFASFIAQGPAPHPRLKFVNGAEGGMTSENWSDPNCPCWTAVNNRLANAGLTNKQVVAAWVKLTTANPTMGFPAEAEALKADLALVVQHLATKFPNLKIAYLSSRIYAGYASIGLSPEPYAYEGGFAVKWLIRDQIHGQLPYSGTGRVAPWLAWGPYLWADGVNPRADGLTWQCGDFRTDDYTHPSPSGRLKVATMLRDFLASDPTSTPWWFQ